MIKYVLKNPFKFGQDEVNEITLNKPSAKDLRDLPVNTSAWLFDHIIKLIVSVSNEPKSKIENFAPADLSGAMEALTPFF